MKKALPIIGFLGCFAIILFALRERSVHGQTVAVMSSTPSTILAGSGSPVTNGIYCGLGAASSTSTSLYDDTSVLTGNSLWKCKVQTDGVTYAWGCAVWHSHHGYDGNYRRKPDAAEQHDHHYRNRRQRDNRRSVRSEPL